MSWQKRLPAGQVLRCGKGQGSGVWLLAAAALLAGTSVAGQVPYRVPATDAKALHAVDFRQAQLVDPQLTALYQACDANKERGGCYTDAAHNTTVLRFADGTIFFDAKMAIDADGSVLSKRAEHPNQPETSFRYPAAPGFTGFAGALDPLATGPGPSLDSERVPYVVMPLGDFRRETGIALGDLAAVVKDGNVQFAIVGDLGPRTHIGEASMKLHEQLGHTICTAYDERHNCSTFTDVSIDPPVLYFFFPDTRKLLYDGLDAGNINQRIATIGEQVWRAFLTRGPMERGAK